MNLTTLNRFILSCFVSGPVLVLLASCGPIITGNPDLVTGDGRYLYDQHKAEKDKRKLQKQLENENKRTGQLSATAETLKQQIGLLKVDRKNQSAIIDSPTTSAQEKSRARSRKEALERQISDLENRLDSLVKVS